MSETTQLSLRAKAAVGGALLGAFMAVLNTQVINTSLPDIQGGIGTGLEDGTWISTAYLIGEIVVIPLSGWLAQAFSLRRYLIASALLFIIFSCACGLATSFPEMVVLRALQGISGGVLIPLALTIVLTLVPARQQPIAFALFALTATFAPAIGPTIGGTITDLYGWRYIFFLNVIPGGLMVAGLAWGLKPAPMQLGLLRHGDWVGIVTICLGLGTLQTVLEEGNKDDWFGSAFILRLSIIAAASLALFLFNALRPGNKAPLVNLRLFKIRNFAFANIASTMLGFSLYAAVYLIPIYLSQSHGYSAAQAGAVMMWIGLPQLALIPLMPKLMQIFDVRRLLTFGFCLFTLGFFMNMNLGPDDSGPQMLFPNLVRAAGQAMVFPAVTAIATAGIARRDAASASSLLNMLRNLGGAVGVAVTQTFLTNREKFHSAIINPHISLLSPVTRQRLAMMQHYFAARGVTDPGAARRQAMIAIGHAIRGQAFYLAYGDAFALLGAGLAVGLVATLFIGKAPTPPGKGA